MGQKETIFDRLVNKTGDLGCAVAFLSFLLVMLPFGLFHMMTWKVSDRRLRRRLRKAGRLLGRSELRRRAESDAESVIVVEREAKGAVRSWWLPGEAFAEAPEVPPAGSSFEESGRRPLFIAWMRREMFGDGGRACCLIGPWPDLDNELRRVAVPCQRPARTRK